MDAAFAAGRRRVKGISSALCFALLCGLPMATPVRAAQFLLPDLPPFAHTVDGMPAGIEYELVAEVLQRMRRHDQVTIVPLARAIANAAHEPGILTFLGRTPGREPGYRWLVPLMDEPFLLFARHDSAVEIGRLEAARLLTIGATRASIGEDVARRLNFTHLQASRDEETNARKLMAGRIDAWLGGLNGALDAAARAGIPRHALREGPVLVNYVIWLAASPDMPLAEVELWRTAFEQVRSDGTLERILHKHAYLSRAK